MTDQTRRSFVRIAAATAATATVGLAGCSEGGDGGADGSNDDGDMTEAEDGMTESGDGMGDMTETDDGMGEMTESGDGMGDMTETDDSMGEMTETGDGMMMEPTDPEEAPRASIDRFSEEGGTLLVRSEENDLPGPDEPVDFDQGPFTTSGLGPNGETVEYYNFDVQPTAPAPIYVLFREGEDDPVEGQLNVVGTIPGDDGYNDFWQVHHVTVPAEYEANTVTSAGQIMDGGYEVEATDTIKNCPIVPDGSTASQRWGDGTADLVEGWYDGEVVPYFLFEEDDLTVSNGSVPISPIYVTFNRNPGEDGGGPASGFMTEEGSDQTHNVVATLPGDDGYSPLWMVGVYDNAEFESVSDLDSASDATILDPNAATVNCPVVHRE